MLLDLKTAFDSDDVARKNIALRRAFDRIEELEDLTKRLRRVERDMQVVENDLREEASGSQDGYVLDIANRIRQIMA